MHSEEEEYLLKLWDKCICPTCGKKIPEGTRVGSGKKSEGGFCSLHCHTTYHEDKLKRNAIKIISRNRRANN
jgi:predicted nucleic acid-binding Zn ribbon protein